VRWVAARLALPLLVPALLVLALVAACDGSATNPPPVASPSAASGAQPPGPAVGATREAIAAALGARRVILQDPPVPYRPAEPASIAAVPRAVYQAVLPADSSHGYIVVYDFRTDAAALAGGRAMAAYVGSPVGRVNFPLGTRFIVRQLGSTVVFYTDLADSPDAQAPDVAEALTTIGTEVPVPS
jgi:hypothetical protein